MATLTLTITIQDNAKAAYVLDAYAEAQNYAEMKLPNETKTQFLQRLEGKIIKQKVLRYAEEKYDRENPVVPTVQAADIST